MGILDLPWYDRPGERLRKDGVDKLSNPDLLKIIIGKGKKESVVKLVNRLLKNHNFTRLDDLSVEEMIKVCRGDKVSAYKILSFFELSKRYNKLVSGGYNKKPITSAKDVFNMFKDELRDYKKERLYVLRLDTKNIAIGRSEIPISEGTLNSSLIHPREVFKEAIRESANSIILVHNHPSGDCNPSKEDIEITEKLVKFGEEFGIKVLDHIIVGKEYWSWREN